MTQVSRKLLKKDIESRIDEIFIESIGMVTNRKHVQMLLEDLLSPTEKIMLAKRLAIAVLLLKRYEQRAISRLLKVGLETVNKISKTLQKGTGGYGLVAHKVFKKEQIAKKWDRIDDLLATLLPLNRNVNHWRRLRWEEKLRDRKPF